LFPNSVDTDGITVPANAVAPAPQKERKVRTFTAPKNDTNCLSLSLGCIAEENFGLAEVQAMNGQPVQCQNCHATLSHLSNVVKSNKLEAQWICEFCSFTNFINVGDAAAPNRQNQEHVLFAATNEDLPKADVPATAASTPSDGEGSIAVFCMDIR